MYIRYSIFVTKNLLTRGAIYRPRPPYVNLHLRIICIFDFLRRPSWSVANRTVKGDRLCYDSIATYIYIYILSNNLWNEGGEKRKRKNTLLIYGQNEKWNETKSFDRNTGAYIYIYMIVLYRGNSRLSQFGIIYIIKVVTIIIGTWNISEWRKRNKKKVREIR